MTLLSVLMRALLNQAASPEFAQLGNKELRFAGKSFQEFGEEIADHLASGLSKQTKPKLMSGMDDYPRATIEWFHEHKKDIEDWNEEFAIKLDDREANLLEKKTAAERERALQAKKDEAAEKLREEDDDAHKKRIKEIENKWADDDAQKKKKMKEESEKHEKMRSQQHAKEAKEADEFRKRVAEPAAIDEIKVETVDKARIFRDKLDDALGYCEGYMLLTTADDGTEIRHLDSLDDYIKARVKVDARLDHFAALVASEVDEEFSPEDKILSRGIVAGTGASSTTLTSQVEHTDALAPDTRRSIKAVIGEILCARPVCWPHAHASASPIPLRGPSQRSRPLRAALVCSVLVCVLVCVCTGGSMFVW